MPTTTRRPMLAITIGDPNGIGPEVVLRALADPEIRALARYRIYAPPALLDVVWDAAAELIRGESAELDEGVAAVRAAVADGADALRLEPLDVDAPVDALAPGRFDPAQAPAQIRALERAADDAVAGRVDGMVTGPINKAIFAVSDSALAYPGQSEFLAERTGASDWAMMLAGERLRVVLATTHVPVRDVADALNAELIERVGRLALRTLREQFGFAEPRLAVAALNPHGGDSAHIGREEVDVIGPAADALRADGAQVGGPLPPDTVFAQAAHGGWDAVLAMYHDQGLIPLKLVDFRRAVNVTIGLPIVRTSADHGVAYDIAGQGKAAPGGTKAALRLAVRLAENLAANRAAGPAPGDIEVSA